MHGVMLLMGHCMHFDHAWLMVALVARYRGWWDANMSTGHAINVRMSMSEAGPHCRLAFWVNTTSFPQPRAHLGKLTINGHFLDSRYIRGYVCKERERRRERREGISNNTAWEPVTVECFRATLQGKITCLLSPNCLGRKPSQRGRGDVEWMDGAISTVQDKIKRTKQGSHGFQGRKEWWNIGCLGNTLESFQISDLLILEWQLFWSILILTLISTLLFACAAVVVYLFTLDFLFNRTTWWNRKNLTSLI